MTVLLLGLGLLAVILILGDRGWHEWRRQTSYRQRIEERRTRAYEDACWAAHREAEAELAMALWRRDWPQQVSRAVAGMSESFARFGVSIERAAARLATLLKGEPEGRP